MPNINLIAERREEKKRIEKTTRSLFLGVVVSAGAVLMLAFFLVVQRLTLIGDLRLAEAELQRVQPTIERVAQIEKDTAELQPKVEVLQTARTDTMRYRALFQVVSQSIPQEAWLSTMSSSGETSDTRITLTGIASSQSLVGEVMTRLNSYPVFDKVDLNFSQAAQPDPLKPTSRISFEILAHLRPVNKKEEAPKDGEKTAQATQKAGGNGNG